jgi:protein-L-isoaspartate(D-aspartate) O-methyltransferase
MLLYFELKVLIGDYFMEQEDLKYKRLRERMVKEHIESRGIKDPRVLAAFLKVKRHLFVSEALMDQTYSDFPLPIGEQQTISQPFIVAEMTQALALTENDRVLEIGTGSGYQAAILAEIAYKVFTVERIHKLLIRARKIFSELGYHNIVTKLSDGTLGWKEHSPFDAIIVTAGSPDIPYPLVNQLAMGGRMVIPVGDQHTQELIKIYRDEKGIHQTTLGGCRFVKLVGEYGWQD